MRQRVGIARALAVDPGGAADGRAVLGARRPDAHADDGGAARRSGSGRARRILYVTHNIQEAVFMADRVRRALAAAGPGARRSCRCALAAPARRGACWATPPSSAASERIWGADQVAGARRRCCEGAALMAAARVTVRHRAAFLVRPRAPRGAGRWPSSASSCCGSCSRGTGWVPALFLPSPLGVLAEARRHGALGRARRPRGGEPRAPRRSASRIGAAGGRRGGRARSASSRSPRRWAAR